MHNLTEEQELAVLQQLKEKLEQKDGCEVAIVQKYGINMTRITLREYAGCMYARVMGKNKISPCGAFGQRSNPGVASVVKASKRFFGAEPEVVQPDPDKQAYMLFDLERDLVGA